MTTETTTVPKSPANAIPAAKHGCCGSEAAPESRSAASERADHEHHLASPRQQRSQRITFDRADVVGHASS